MSRTTPIEYRDRMFWAHDVNRSILLAQVVQIGDELERPGWDDEQLDTFVGLLVEADRRLAERRAVTAAEALDWRLKDDLFVLWRGAEHVDTAPIVELGEAVIQLIRGTLPAEAPHTRWYFGREGGPSTIGHNAA